MGRLRAAAHAMTQLENKPANILAKIEVRQRALDAIGADRARVLDLYAGDGHMYREVWCKAASYVGCDEKFFRDDRLAYVVDNRRLLRSIDLLQFNIVDFDAFGSPWEQVYILTARRKLRRGESMALVMTEGSSLKLRLGGLSDGLALLSGLRSTQPGLDRKRAEIMDRALARVAEVMGGRIEARWQAAERQGSRMMYLGMLLRALG